jgi:hypothetical protein
MKATASAADKNREARDAKARAGEAYQQAVSQAEENASNNQKAMYDSMNGIQKEILTTNQAVADSNLKDSAAFAALQEQQMRIELECSKRATAVVNGMVSEAIAGIKSGTFNRGSQTDLFRQVGLTDRQSWQKQAAIRKRQCMEGEDTKDSMKSAASAFEQSKQANATARKAAQDQIDMLKQQMNQIMNPTGCGATAANGANMVTQACRDADAVRKKTMVARRTRDAAIAAADENLKEATTAADAAAKAKETQIGEAKAELTEYSTRLAALKEAEKAQDTYPRAGAQADDARKLDISAIELTDHAGRLRFCCDKRPRKVSEAACTASERFLTARGFPVAATSPSGSTTTTTTAPAVPTSTDPSPVAPGQAQ